MKQNRSSTDKKGMDTAGLLNESNLNDLSEKNGDVKRSKTSIGLIL